MTETLKQFLQSLSFIEIDGIKRHAKGLVIALEKSNRKEFLNYEVKYSVEPEDFIIDRVLRSVLKNKDLRKKFEEIK